MIVIEQLKKKTPERRWNTDEKSRSSTKLDFQKGVEVHTSKIYKLLNGENINQKVKFQINFQKPENLKDLQASERLLSDHAIYMQYISQPTT